MESRDKNVSEKIGILNNLYQYQESRLPGSHGFSAAVVYWL